MVWMERPDGAAAINGRPLNAYPEGGQGAVAQAWEDALLHNDDGATKNKKGRLGAVAAEQRWAAAAMITPVDGLDEAG